MLWPNPVFPINAVTFRNAYVTERTIVISQIVTGSWDPALPCNPALSFGGSSLDSVTYSQAHWELAGGLAHVRTFLKAVATVCTALELWGLMVNKNHNRPSLLKLTIQWAWHSISIQMERLISGGDKSYKGIKSAWQDEVVWRGLLKHTEIGGTLLTLTFKLRPEE